MNENQSPEVETANIEEIAVVQTYARRPFTVKAVRVTEDNIGTIADWCGGEVHSSKFAKDGKVGNRSFIKVPVQRPMNEKQTQAFVGDWVLQHSDGSWKVYIDKAFKAIFVLVPVVQNELAVGPVYDAMVSENTLPKRLPGEHMHSMLKTDAPFTPDNWFKPEAEVTNTEV